MTEAIVPAYVQPKKTYPKQLRPQTFHPQTYQQPRQQTYQLSYQQAYRQPQQKTAYSRFQPQTPSFISETTGLDATSDFSTRSYAYTAPTYAAQAQGTSFSYKALL